MMIDSGIVLFFKGPNSYTGEDLVEFHLHGGNAIKAKFLLTLSQFPTFREALPGEFTKTALLNDKLDLTQAEGINQIINAETNL